MSTDHEADSFYSALPMLARDSTMSEGSETEIDEFILTEMCKEVAAVFGGADYDSENFDSYDDYAMKDVGGDESSSIKSSVMIDIVRKSLAGVQIEGTPAIDRFSRSLGDPEEQRKLLEYFKNAKLEKEKQEREKAEQQEAERIKREEQDRKEREEREAKAKKEKEEKERKEKERQRRKRKEKEERERKERKEREAKEKAEREAREKAEAEAKARREQRERERREMQAVEEEYSDVIEVAPGLTLPLLSKDATFRALKRKDVITATCFICQQRLTAPGHVDFIVCCDDWICMAVEDKPPSDKRCIGFGLKDAAITQWRNSISSSSSNAPNTRYVA